MKREPVKSSNLQSVGFTLFVKGDPLYKPFYGTLEIEFKDGSVYQYYSVEQHIFKQLMRASSLGSFLHKHIRDKYKYLRTA